jgi:hypothetical protein
MPDQTTQSEVSNRPFNLNGNLPALQITSVTSPVPDPPSSAPKTHPLPEFLEQLERMEELRAEQRRELMASAVLCREEFPLTMIDRGVLHSEIPKDESNFPLDDMTFDPKSVRITTIQGGKLRSVAVIEESPVRGPFIDKSYIFVPPKSATGLSKGQIQRIISKVPGVSSRSSKKKVYFANADEIVKKASELKLNAHNANVDESNPNLENIDTSDEGNPSDPSKAQVTESDDELLM